MKSSGYDTSVTVIAEGFFTIEYFKPSKNCQKLRLEIKQFLMIIIDQIFDILLSKEASFWFDGKYRILFHEVYEEILEEIKDMVPHGSRSAPSA